MLIEMIMWPHLERLPRIAPEIPFVVGPLPLSSLVVGRIKMCGLFEGEFFVARIGLVPHVLLNILWEAKVWHYVQRLLQSHFTAIDGLVTRCLFSRVIVIEVPVVWERAAV
jgi:hypothetical protein